MPTSDHRGLIYLLALVAGAGFALFMFPPELIAGLQTFITPPAGDSAAHIVGQRYFLVQPWHWPLLVADQLVPPDGTNIAFTDSIPLLSLVTKLVSGWLPPSIQTINFWLALCWVLQPAAAVFTLRSAGERRVVPCAAVAILALCIPSLYWRTGHEALSSHFLILLALGNYFNLLKGVSWPRLLFAATLMLVALLVHPYIMVMVMALQAAVPCSLLFRGQTTWRRAALGVAAGVAVTAGVAMVLGYTKAYPSAGFASYSMNLLSPAYPVASPLIPWIAGPIDATGGQYEGFHYLGVGGLLLIFVASALIASRRFVALRRHAGLVAISVALTLLALSTKVYAGHVLLLRLPTPAVLEHFHGSGRFFWPVTYILLIGGAGVVSRLTSATVGGLLLGSVAILQLVETANLRADVRELYRGPARHWVIEADTLRPVLKASDRLNIWPTAGCGADAIAPAFLQLLILAAERPIPLNTMYVARQTSAIACDPAPYLQHKLAPRELRVFLPAIRTTLLTELAGWKDVCRRVGEIVACSEQLVGRWDLPGLDMDFTPLNRTLPTSTGAEGVAALGDGWGLPEPWGVWSIGPDAVLVLRIPSQLADQPLRLTLWAQRFPSRSGDARVDVRVNGAAAGGWNVGTTEAVPLQVTLPPQPELDAAVLVQFHIVDPTSPRDIGKSNDARTLGLGVHAFRIETQPR